MEKNSSSELPLLTYNSLFNILREERKMTDKLYDLPSSFYLSVEKFFLNKKKEIDKFRSEKNLEKLKKEKKIYLNSKKIFNEILSLRCQKISKIAIENEMAKEEVFNEELLIEKEKDFLKSVQDAVKKLVK